MKRLFTLLVASAALLVMAIAAAGVRADGSHESRTLQGPRRQ
jgi:hypothetical protein